MLEHLHVGLDDGLKVLVDAAKHRQGARPPGSAEGAVHAVLRGVGMLARPL
jgi:hypothetical protein